MTHDPLTSLSAVNPVPHSTAPPIEHLWRRLDEAPELKSTGASTRPGNATVPGARPARTSRLIVAVTVAVAVAIAVGAVLALQPSDHRPARPDAASSATSLTRILGVLRRPQTAADRSLPTPRLPMDRRPKRLTEAGTLVPETITPISSLKRVTAALPGGMRIGFIPVQIRSRTASGRPFDRVALEVTGGGGSSCCSTAHQIETGQAFSSSGGAGQKTVGMLVVPDGVARVRLALPHPVTVDVHDNVAGIESNADLENIDRYAMTWYAPSGAIVKQFATPRDNKPTPAQARAQRNLAIRTAEHTNVHLRPLIRASYPIFASDFTATRAGSGPTGFILSRAKLAQLPTFAIAEAGTVPKYRTDPRNARLLHIETGLDLWLAAGGRICIFARSARNARCTPTGPADSGLVTTPAGQPAPPVIVALVPKNNAAVTVETTSGSRSVPTHDGVVVTAATHVTAMRFKGSDGQPVVHRNRSK